MLNDSPILYFRHISSPSAIEVAPWGSTTTAVADTEFVLGGSRV
jgi:hypothetical protein